MAGKLILEILPENQKELLDKLSGEKWITPFYMAGGTALALQIEHRESIDLDFFSGQEFKPTNIIQKLEKTGKFKLFYSDSDTINGQLNGVKISLFCYRYKTIDKFIAYKKINIAGKMDIALMKLEAISGRGSRKDFIDLFFLLKEITLKQMLSKYRLKYGKELGNQYHLMKSLVYFDDAEKEPMPKMLQEFDWNQVKSEIVEQVGKLEKDTII